MMLAEKVFWPHSEGLAYLSVDDLPMTIRLRPARLLAALALSTAAVGACAAPAPSTGQFLQFLQTRAASDQQAAYAVTGLSNGEHFRDLAVAILAALGEQQAYRDDMRAWLAAQPIGTQEQLATQWIERYRRIMWPAFAFVDDQTISRLYRLIMSNALADTPRADCRTRTADEARTLNDSLAKALIDEHKVAIGNAMALAYARELQRLALEKGAAQPFKAEGVMRAIPVWKKLTGTLPAADAAVVERIVFGDGEDMSSQQATCDERWVLHRAVLGASYDGAALLRQSIIEREYYFGFQPLNLSLEGPPTPGFTAGRTVVALPAPLTRRLLKGRVKVNIDVDKAGKVLAVTARSHTLTPDVITGANGEPVASVDLFMQAVEAWYRGGRFAPRLVDGMPVAFSVTQDMYGGRFQD